jgi:hypothetical protein
MTARRTLSRVEVVTIAGLVVGAAGIAVLWASGVEFPIYPPPGVIILLAGAIFMGLAPWPWSPGVGAFMGLFVTVGFLVEAAVGGTGLENLSGNAGTGRLIGQGAQLVGVVTALVAGVVATRDSYRGRAQARR